MDKRILAVLIAALAGAGAASAQPAYLTSGATGAPVSNGVGGCWQTGASDKTAAPCPAPQMQRTAASGTTSTRRDQLAQADSSGRYRAPAAAGASRTTTVAPRNDAYVISNGGTAPLVNAEGQCVHSGSWTPSKAAEPCDVVPRASAPAPVVAQAPEPAPAPLAQAAPAEPPRVIEKVTLSTDVLFPFNKAELLPGGKDKLGQLAKDAQGAEVDKVVLAGYADRIGSEEYNKDLSERRAQAVADYLASQGVEQSRIQVEGHGKDNPVTGDQCQHMGKENAKNQKLIACLQPDRRVEAELLGSREASTGGASPAGATSGGSTSSSTGGGESSSGSSTR